MKSKTSGKKEPQEAVCYALPHRRHLEAGPVEVGHLERRIVHCDLEAHQEQAEPVPLPLPLGQTAEETTNELTDHVNPTSGNDKNVAAMRNDAETRHPHPQINKERKGDYLGVE